MSQIARPDGAAGSTPAPALPPVDALIIVPPFAAIHMPSMSVHSLQACAKAAGFRVRVLYANLLFAARIGEEKYETVVHGLLTNRLLVGERIFAEAAYGDLVPRFGRHQQIVKSACNHELMLSWNELLELEATARDWVDEIAEAVARDGTPIVGCTAMFQQTSSSVALLRRIKKRCAEADPPHEVITVIGGANCEGEMAEGVADLSDELDFVFSGESESSWLAFLAALKKGQRPSERIVRGPPCVDLDALPTPSYTEFYEQRASSLPQASLESIWLPFETSRGCWWGQKTQCKFCGLNALGIRARKKSPQRVLQELSDVVVDHPSRKFLLTDNLMPRANLTTLVPLLEENVPDLIVFSHQRSTLSLENMGALARAGILLIQPGIEALSSSLLQRMNKGIATGQNIVVLRYARSCGIACVMWHLLHDIPGDQVTEWEETLALMPLLRHLHPPLEARAITIARFSTYFDQPEEHGLRNVRPVGVADVFPSHVDAAKLAFAFEADYACASRERPDLIEALHHEVELWRAAWFGDGAMRPCLSVQRFGAGLFVLRDTRNLSGTQPVQLVSREKASVALVAGRGHRSSDVDWALENRVGVMVDGAYVPLATASPELWKEFERTGLP